MTIQEKYLKIAEEVIEKGPYKPDWLTFSNYEPQWIKMPNLAFLSTGGFLVSRHFGMSGIPGICIYKVWRNENTTVRLLGNIQNLATKILSRCLLRQSLIQKSG